VLYGVSVGRLNEAVKRNRDRFPVDFMFQLTSEEFVSLRSQVVSLNLKSQIAISSSDWGGRRHPPFAFTEHGVAMLSSVLRSKRAVQVNIEIMSAFVRLFLDSVNDLNGAKRLNDWNDWNGLRHYEAVQFKVVFDAIRQLMHHPSRRKEKSDFWWKKRPPPTDGGSCRSF
jgi:ORF6N domain